jgi:uncharacterized protein with von Willebrand factor type A (vWA) domain
MEIDQFICLQAGGSRCYRCMAFDSGDGQALSEISRSTDKSLKSLLKQMNKDQPGLKKKAGQKSRERLEGEKQKLLDDIENKVGRGDIQEQMEQQIQESEYQADAEISAKDVEDALKDLNKKGLINQSDGDLKITPKGAGKIGQYVLSIIQQKLMSRAMGPHTTQRQDYGAQLSTTTRRYEPGDEYHRIDFEKTLLNSIENSSAEKGFTLKMEDLQVFDERHETQLVAGLIIDESGSMAGDKLHAAVETALALAELIRKEPKDKLKTYLFSSKVREIPYYELANVDGCGDTTDIRAGLRSFRRDVANERGDKQAYLITDAGSNTLDGGAVGFSQATSAVMQEALKFRQAGITLNIIMLDTAPDLKDVAAEMARKNLGRVIFTTPENLGEVVIRDYLAAKNSSNSHH